MNPEGRSAQQKPEVPVRREESTPPDAEPLDSILSDMVGALKDVREVLANTVQNFPVLEDGHPVAIAVRRSDGSPVQVPVDIEDPSK